MQRRAHDVEGTVQRDVALALQRIQELGGIGFRQRVEPFDEQRTIVRELLGRVGKQACQSRPRQGACKFAVVEPFGEFLNFDGFVAAAQNDAGGRRFGRNAARGAGVVQHALDRRTQRRRLDVARRDDVVGQAQLDEEPVEFFAQQLAQRGDGAGVRVADRVGEKRAQRKQMRDQSVEPRFVHEAQRFG